MTTLLQFNQVELDKVDDLSFCVSAGECRILKVPSPEAKSAVIEMAVGESLPVKGEVLFNGQAVETCMPGGVGWIPASGGLISNLKAWENITLPLWFHTSRQVLATEEAVARWLSELKLDKQEWEKFMASPAARLKPWERKLAGLLRGLIQAPQLLVVDAALFDDEDETRIQAWIKALEKFVSEADNRALLVISSGDTMLPWNKIEWNQDEITG
jgi:phospholipid/cholesterol/gamma-HCH transport system ATP-binding protein